MADHQAAAAANAAAEAHPAVAPGVKRQRLTPEQKIARLREQLARATAQHSKRSRQQDAREKIVIGGAVIRAMRENEAFRWQIVSLLQTNVTRDIDREAIASWLSGTSTHR